MIGRVAIVGAGLGGLASAALLARRGHRVDVFEQHSEPGGFATTWARGGYRFEASLHLMDAVGKGQPNGDLLDELGIAEAITWCAPDPMRRDVWCRRGVAIDVPQGAQAWLAAMQTRFPADRDGFPAFLARAGAAHAACYRLMRGTGDATDALAVFDLSRAVAADVIASHITDPIAREALGALSCYFGLPAARLSALNLAILLYGYQAYGGAYPIGGSRSIVEALVRVIRANGGEVHVGTPVAAITVRRGRARGLILGDGTPVDADAVVSNVSPLTTFGRLIPADAVDARFRDRLAAMEPSCSFFKVHLALDCDARALADMPYEAFLYETDASAFDRPVTCVVTAANQVDPSCCPAGAGVLSITQVAPATDVPGLPHDERERLCDALVGRVERHLLPGLSNHVIHRELNHPGTFLRYTGSPRGVVLGFAATPGQAGPRGLQATTPIGGLFQAGAWITPGAGQSAAMLSGRAAAAAIDAVIA